VLINKQKSQQEASKENRPQKRYEFFFKSGPNTGKSIFSNLQYYQATIEPHLVESIPSDSNIPSGIPVSCFLYRLKELTTI
jgi:hypothetical protein